MDKEYVKKCGLTEAVRRFNQINEYTFITSPTLSEDDDEPTDNKQNDGGMSMDGGQDGNGQQPGGDMQGGDAPQPQRGAMGGGNDQSQGQGQPMDGGMQGGGMDTPQAPMGGGPAGGDNGMMSAPQGGSDMMGGGDNSALGDDDEFGEVETEEMESDDEVIDVDDLTNSQEATEYKVDDVNDKLTRLLRVVQKYSDAIDQSNQKIADLKAEFERRNPTPEEQLNIRSQASYPYSETPKDYWDKKTSENPNYNVMYDNDVPANKEQEEFKIRQSDIDNIDSRSIADSFDEPLKLNKFLRF